MPVNKLLFLFVILTLLCSVSRPPICVGQVTTEVVLPRSTDTGQTLYSSISAADDHNCMVAGSVASGTNITLFVERSPDGGKTWFRYPLPKGFNSASSNNVSYNVCAIDSLTYVLTGDTGIILRSEDGGANWSNQTYPTAVPLGAASFCDRMHGIIIGGGGLLLRTADGGAHWDSIPGLPYAFFVSPKMFSTDTFVVCKYGTGPLYWFRGSQIDTSQLIDDPAILNPLHWSTSVAWNGLQNVISIGVDRTKEQDDQGGSYSMTWISESSDEGNSWQTLIDRNTRVSSGPSRISIDSSGAAVALGKSRNVLYRDHVGQPWIEDTLASSAEFSGAIGVSMLDRTHALAILGIQDAVSSIVRITLPTFRSVERGEKYYYGTHEYPNPSDGHLCVLTTYQNDGLLELVDPVGRVAYRGFISKTAGTTQLNCSDLSSGVYQVLIQSAGSMTPAGKIVIQKK